MSKKIKVTNLNKKYFEIRDILPDENGMMPTDEISTTILASNQRLLSQCSILYDSLANLRNDREANVRNYFGDQLSTRIPNPDGCGMITERQYCINQGMVPLCVNVIRAQGKSLVGVYLQDKYEPLIVTNIREEQKVGEMLTQVMQNVYHSLNLYRLFPRGYEEFLLSSIPCYRTRYDWVSRKKADDVIVEQCDINRMFWDNNTSGKYFENISLIGYLHDMTIGEVFKLFAKTPRERASIEAIYNQCRNISGQRQQFQQKKGEQTLSFFSPLDPEKCRVIEVWNKENREVFSCHDTGTGEVYTLPYTVESEDEIRAINDERKKELADAGGDPSRAKLIDSQYRNDDVWVVRFMAPNGAVLRQQEDVYLHGSHPFSIGAYPLVDGEVHSLIGDTLNAQRMINRAHMRMEFEEMARAKGFSLVDKEALELSDMTEKVFGRRYTSAKGFAPIKVPKGKSLKDVFAQYNTTGAGTQYGMQKINFYMEIINKITGANGALRGEEAKANTPAALYAQQAANANNNIADGQEWYNGLIEEVDYKILMNILQNYDKDRYLEIVGSEYEREIDYILNHDMRNVLFKISLIKSPSTGVARSQSENMLERLYIDGAIPAELWLEMTSIYGADKTLEKLKIYNQEKAEAAAQQQMIQQANPDVQQPMQ